MIIKENMYMLFKYIGRIFPLAISFTHGNVSSLCLSIQQDIPEMIFHKDREESSFLFMMVLSPLVIEWFIAASDEHLRSCQCFSIANRLQQICTSNFWPCILEYVPKTRWLGQSK